MINSISKNGLFLVLLCFFLIQMPLSGQNDSGLKQLSYGELITGYDTIDNYRKPAVWLYLQAHIDKAKEEKNYNQLFYAYRNGAYYAAVEKRLFYNDSAIWSANQTRDFNLISHATVSKGITFYNQKQYQKALEQFLSAQTHLEKAKDPFQVHRNNYHIALTKKYLGHYEESIVLYDRCLAFFDEPPAGAHKNTVYNYRLYYLRSIFQLAENHQKTGNLQKAEELVFTGAAKAEEWKGFLLETSLLTKARGANLYYAGRYGEAIKELEKSLCEIDKNGDFARVSEVYYFQAKSYLGLGQEEKALSYFTKVDSIFTQHGFLQPELRDMYELLMAHYEKEGDKEKQLYYSNQLVKAGKLWEKDFTYLYAKMPKEYMGQEYLKANIVNGYWVYLIIVPLVLVLVFPVLWFVKKKKEENSVEPVAVYNSQQELAEPEPVTGKEIGRKKEIGSELLVILQKKLEDFENERGYLTKSLTIGELSKSFDTNPKYLSQAILKTYGQHFTDYIHKLKIEYIAKEMKNAEKATQFSIDQLAEISGFGNRNTFSDAFYKIMGVRPAKFLKEMV